MTRAQKLKDLSREVGRIVATKGTSTRSPESRARSVYGNLAIERPNLTMEQVRRDLGEDRPG